MSDSPPEIPAITADSATHPGGSSAHLIWIRTGIAHIQLNELPGEQTTEEFRLTAGEGLWIPEGTHRRIVTDAGTVAFPLWFHSNSSLRGLTRAVHFEVSASWQDWLIQHFNLQVTPLGGDGYSSERITDLVLGATSPTCSALDGADGPRAGNATIVPIHAGARTVAEELLGNPALDLTVEQWAARALVSPRTLRRAFLTETGLTFEQWRLRCRLNSSVQYLAAEHRVDQVATRVGFASRNGFTRAFRAQFGHTPRQFTRELTTRPTDSELALHATAAHQVNDLANFAQRVDMPSAPDLLLPARTPAHTNSVHVLSWMYRGSGYLDAGGRHYERGKGVATWIPAHLEHTTGIHADSISLPIGTVTTADLYLDKPLQVAFPESWDNYLMYCAVSSRSVLRPDDYDPTQILTLFSSQLAAQQALSLPMPTDPRAHTAATNYLRYLGRPGSASVADRTVGLPTDLRRVFRDQTGMTFSQWCYAARMRIARDLLVGGARPSTVARRVGYSHLPTFSTAFSRFHGIPPREYQEREQPRQGVSRSSQNRSSHPPQIHRPASQ